MMVPDTFGKYDSDLIIKRASERTIEVAIETLIKVSVMIISAERMGLLQSEETIFDILEEKKVIDPLLCLKLKKNERIQKSPHSSL